jgi:multisubunit Na+/H+ antiporter MnhB subunit
MRKKRPAAGDATPDASGHSPGKPPTVPIPRTVDLAVIAVFAEAFFTLLRAVALRGYTSQLSQWLIDTNNKATGKNHKANYGPDKVAHDLAQLRSGALTQGLIITAALVLLGLALRRTRAASGARWALLVVIVLTSGPLAIMPVDGWPTLPKAAGVLMGASAIAAIVLIVWPRSMNYFRDCKAASRPAGAPARPGLAGLFAPRPAPQRGGPATSPGRGAARSGAGAQSGEDANPARAKAKAKVRADADAVAKGAELARARAKANKPRR